MLRKALLLLLVPLVLAGTLFALRNPIATWFATQKLARHGIHCDALSVSLAATFSKAEVAPTRCTLAEGSVQSIALSQGASVPLHNFSPSEIVVPQVRIELRHGEVPEVAGLLHERANDGLRSGLQALARVANTHVPPLRISELRIAKAAHALDLQQVRVAHSNRGLQVSVETIPAQTSWHERSIRAGVHHLELHIASTSVQCRGQLTLAYDGPLAHLARSTLVQINAEQLNTAAPRISVQLERNSPPTLRDRLFRRFNAPSPN